MRAAFQTIYIYIFYIYYIYIYIWYIYIYILCSIRPLTAWHCEPQRLMLCPFYTASMLKLRLDVGGICCALQDVRSDTMPKNKLGGNKAKRAKATCLGSGFVVGIPRLQVRCCREIGVSGERWGKHGVDDGDLSEVLCVSAAMPTAMGIIRASSASRVTPRSCQGN